MKTYIVGGAVRDALLGFPVQDRDFVVVGASPEEMLAKGYLPVGKDFPVFLHPQTHDEYALARTERKTAAGYKGFVFHTDANVTLEEDLIRRDLTINAMAQDEAGNIIDPYGGLRDLHDRVFRHVSMAFCEDPVRILRLARFAARFATPPQNFTVAEETTTLMQRMVAAGEVDALVAERVWQELSRGLMEAQPSRMFAVLRSCGALQRLLPELNALFETEATGQRGQQLMQILDATTQRNSPLTTRFAVLLHDVAMPPTGTDTLPVEKLRVKLADGICQRLKVPADCRDMAVMLAREHLHIKDAASLSAADTVDLLTCCDALRKPERFLEMLNACACLFPEELTTGHIFAPQLQLSQALDIVLKVNGGEIASLYAAQPQQIPIAIRAGRINALEVAANAQQ